VYQPDGPNSRAITHSVTQEGGTGETTPPLFSFLFLKKIAQKNLRGSGKTRTGSANSRAIDYQRLQGDIRGKTKKRLV